MINNLNIKLSNEHHVSKQQQLINELLRVINTRLKKGDPLPSVNTLSNGLKISRDTVFKAYSELKRRRIVGSAPTKGYYVSKEMNKVLLLLDFYSPFKDIVYREIESRLGPGFSIDLIFHHYNIDLFETVILESIGRYNAYLIMNFDTQEFVISEVLKKIDPSKMLLMDIPVFNWKDFEKEKYNYLWQDFDKAVFNSLEILKQNIKKYKRFILISPQRLKHPSNSIGAFTRFCEKNKIKSATVYSASDIGIQKGDALFVLRQRDLIELLSICKEKNLKIGTDVGILAYNDSQLYEFIAPGITVISTNFKEMGRKAAEFVKEGTIFKEVLSTTVILRNSL